MVPKVVFVLGGPGAGKGTQCQQIAKEYDFVHLSAGDLLREERSKPNSKYGQLIEKYIQEGKIVPVDITCSLLENAMIASGKNKFLIDGFPRNQDNLDGWNKRVADKVELVMVLYFNCPLEVCTERCLSRGAAGSGRSDDNIESLHKRFRTYTSETKPIIDYYKSKQLVQEVDSTKSTTEVFENVKGILNNFDTNGDI